MKDIELRKIILLADTKTEFIQMLGRKRADGTDFDLYIFKYDKNHFVRRRHKMDALDKVADEYWKQFSDKIMAYIPRDISQEKNVDWTILNWHESLYMCNQSTLLLDKVIKRKVSYDIISSLFYVYSGRLRLNPLSFYQVKVLMQYYTEMIAAFETLKEDAFLFKQLEWLGKSIEESREIVDAWKEGAAGISRKRVISEFEKKEEICMTREEFLTVKVMLKSDLLKLIQALDDDVPDKQKHIDSCKKNDRPISEQDMNFLREFCKIPYELEVRKMKSEVGSIYIIKRVEE